MDEQQQKDSNDVTIVDMPTDTKTWIEYISKERQRVIQPIAQKGKKAGQVPDLTVEPTKSQYPRLAVLLKRLDENIDMTPNIKSDTKIDIGLKVVSNEQDYHFPKADAEKAKNLLERFESERWGANEVFEDERDSEGSEVKGGEAEEEPKPKRRKKSIATETDGEDEDKAEYDRIMLPPSHHPIFGVDGIMHGLALKKGKRRTHVLNPNLPRRSAKVYGHNGLAVGAWFPMQLVALARGAHGVSQGGISGNRETGAYSIVVSGHYDDLDQDYGHTLYYSGSNSHDNKDPRAPPPSTGGTRALQASLISEKPVRVLRAESGKSTFAPHAGFRYDGLYKVVSTQHSTNMNGGKYEQFKLVRLEGQPKIDYSRPTPKERRDYETIGQGY